MAKKTRINLTCVVVALIISAAMVGSTLLYINFIQTETEKKQRGDQMKIDLKNQQDCIKSGKEYVDKLVKEESWYNSLSADAYFFNWLDNTCYASLRRILPTHGGENPVIVMSIVDIYSNMEVIQVYDIAGGGDENWAKWKEAADKYMDLDY